MFHPSPIPSSITDVKSSLSIGLGIKFSIWVILIYILDISAVRMKFLTSISSLISVKLVKISIDFSGILNVIFNSIKAVVIPFEISRWGINFEPKT